MQTRPIVSKENGIAGIRWIVLYAGSLTGGDAAQMGANIEAGYVLSGFISDAGNGIGVVEKLLSTVGRQGRALLK